jgi:hypothetical protein
MRFPIIKRGKFLLFFALCAALAGISRGQEPELVAHEWGTFTSIAGNSGAAVEWFPWAVPSDLPQFVEHLESRNLKLNLSGTIRMETPVLYFYSPRETSVSVHVSFSRGLITEWYPQVTRFTPSGERRTLQPVVLNPQEANGSIAWDSVGVRPGDANPLEREAKDSRYYAARATASAPLRVSSPAGAQYEKFLFYRGVSAEASPVVAVAQSDGSVAVGNRSGEPIAELFLVERRADTAGFRSIANLEQATKLPPPVLDSSLAAVSEQILSVLMNQGLYPDEARAMLETWKDSWFEEGSRLLYIVPRTFVDRVLPLSISPAPRETTRVFIGRLELVSPRTQEAIETALASGDEPTLARYNRFLEPMLEILAERETDPSKVAEIRRRLERPYARLLAEE